MDEPTDQQGDHERVPAKKMEEARCIAQQPFLALADESAAAGNANLMAFIRNVVRRSGLANMIVITLCLALGLLLAQRFKVLVLVPATLLVALVALAGGVDANSFWMKTLMAGLMAASLQIGYLVGLGARALLSTARTSSRNSLANSTRPTQRTAH